MDVYVARQPILNAKQDIYAYELLFRSGLRNAFDGVDSNAATSQVVQNALVNIGFNTLTNGLPAFINFTQDLLLQGMPTLLPKENVVIEVLEDIPPTDEIIDCLKSLREQGYTIALDDFVATGKHDRFVPYADIIKVDFLESTHLERKSLAEKLSRSGVTLLAEKVETLAEFEEAKELGYTLFQGYFFNQPVIISGKSLETAEITILDVLRQIHQNPMDYAKIETSIKRDVSLSYNLLRMVNSAALRRAKPIDSIGHALVMLGETEIRKWMSLVVMAKIGRSRPGILLNQSLVRGRFLELLSPKLGLREEHNEMFLLGMFSLIDALMARPLKDIIQEIPLAEEIKNALVGKSSRYGSAYRLVMAYEKADWNTVVQISEHHHLKDTLLPELYLEATQWANESAENAWE